MYEYNLAKEVVKEGKSCGVDDIRPEVLQICNIDKMILYFCNKALLDKMKPIQWSILNIILIPKKGDISLGSNYGVMYINVKFIIFVNNNTNSNLTTFSCK